MNIFVSPLKGSCAEDTQHSQLRVWKYWQVCIAVISCRCSFLQNVCTAWRRNFCCSGRYWHTFQQGRSGPDKPFALRCGADGEVADVTLSLR